ncbi:MAG: glycosyltransferase family 2 protein [Prevotella sp.]|nr:glycosyltransferase family 2 protein [Prevotella sp.]MBQ3700006.1 glycosyltransferase family 2 protein [Prevotella sp.]
MSAFYTIIIPHYNIPDLLRRSLASIPHREDVQVIVIDDHSNDASLSELRELQTAFPAVQFFYLDKNMGAGHARNVGIRYAAGEYLLFLDADDYFNDCINAFLDDYKDEEADIVFFNADAVDPITLKPSDRANKLNLLIDDYFSRKASDSISLRYLHSGPCCKMVRKDLIDCFGISFDEIPAVEDVIFSYLVGYYAKTIKVDDRKVYCITYRSDSLSNTYTSATLLILTEVMGKKNRFMIDQQIPIFDEDLLIPFRKALKSKKWSLLNHCFLKAREYGFSKSYILYKMVRMSIRCRIKNFQMTCIGRCKK